MLQRRRSQELKVGRTTCAFSRTYLNSNRGLIKLFPIQNWKIPLDLVLVYFFRPVKESAFHTMQNCNRGNEVFTQYLAVCQRFHRAPCRLSTLSQSTLSFVNAFTEHLAVCQHFHTAPCRLSTLVVCHCFHKVPCRLSTFS